MKDSFAPLLLLGAAGALAWWLLSPRTPGGIAVPPTPPPPPAGAPPGTPPAYEPPPDFTGTVVTDPGAGWEQASPALPAGPTGPGGGWTQASWRSAPQQVIWQGGRPWAWTARGWQRLY
jgi:hypothetical protein